MASVTNGILSDIGYRAGRETLARRMYELDHPSRPEAAASGAVAYGGNRKRIGLLGAAAYGLFLAACSGRVDNPTIPTNPSTLTLHVYNATTGQRKDMTVEVPNDPSSINAQNLASGLGDVVTSEFAVRTPGADNLGQLVMAAGSQANVASGNYDVFVPAVATRPNGQSVYDCMPNPSLNGGKRDTVVGVLNKPGVDPNGLPMYIWTDAIDELHRNMQSDSGIRYGSIKFDPTAANPDFTVGFANENLGGPAWAEGYKHAYMLGPKSVFPLDYNRPTVRDGALEELFEMIFQVNNICSSPGTREVIGKALETNDREWGLNDVGKNLMKRNFTRSR